MTYKIELTREQLAIISDALMNMPYGRVFNLVVELQKQVKAQEPKLEAVKERA